MNGLAGITADDRQEVRGYYTALWVWNRLDNVRWEKAKVALLRSNRRDPSPEVDHIVAWSLWQSKISGEKSNPESDASRVNLEDLAVAINELGNCMLLRKDFNISKSDKPLGKFFEDVHEFKEGKMKVDEWAAALRIDMAQVNCGNTPAAALRDLFAQRSQKIRSDLESFIRGGTVRVDLGTGSGAG